LVGGVVSGAKSAQSAISLWERNRVPGGGDLFALPTLFAHLASTVSPAKHRPAASRPKEREQHVPERELRRPRPASLVGTDDEFCHMFAAIRCGGTRCAGFGLSRRRRSRTTGCRVRNHHPSCPECIALSREGGR
jgi:hypothetical protein